MLRRGSRHRGSSRLGAGLRAPMESRRRVLWSCPEKQYDRAAAPSWACSANSRQHLLLDAGKEIVDEPLPAAGERGIEHELADREVEDAEPERTEHRDLLLGRGGLGSPLENVRQRTADEGPRSHRL